MSSLARSVSADRRLWGEHDTQHEGWVEKGPSHVLLHQNLGGNEFWSWNKAAGIWNKFRKSLKKQQQQQNPKTFLTILKDSFFFFLIHSSDFYWLKAKRHIKGAKCIWLEFELNLYLRKPVWHFATCPVSSLQHGDLGWQQARSCSLIARLLYYISYTLWGVYKNTAFFQIGPWNNKIQYLFPFWTVETGKRLTNINT